MDQPRPMGATRVGHTASQVLTCNAGAARRRTNPRTVWTLAGAALALTLVAAGGMASPMRSDQPGSQAPPEWAMTAYEAVSRPSDVRELAFGVRGRIAECLVMPGDRVRTGHEIIRMDDVVQKATVALARLQADNHTQLETAQATVEFRRNDLEKVQEASASGAANDRELWDSQYRLRVAELDVTAAGLSLQEAALVLEREQARLDEMTLRSPIDGFVVDVHKRGGEAVDEQTTVATVIRIDPLWIDVNVQTRDALRLRAGQSAGVEWQDVDQAGAMMGRIIFISPAGHAGARQVMVRLEVANPDALPAGLHATVRFMPPGSDGAGRVGAETNPGHEAREGERRGVAG